MSLAKLAVAHPWITAGIVAGGGYFLLRRRPSSGPGPDGAGVVGGFRAPGSPKPGTFGPKGPRATKAVSASGTYTATYSQTNNAGVVGGAIPFTAKDAPTIDVPASGWLGKVVSGTVGKLVETVKHSTGGKLYPDTWTEPDGEMFEVGAFALDDPADIWAEVDVSARFGSTWYMCRRLTFEVSSVSVSRELSSPEVYEVGQQSSFGRIACLYSERKYSAAGLSLKIKPRPVAPGTIRLYLVVSQEGSTKRMGIYLWLPPRLGGHRADVEWRAWT